MDVQFDPEIERWIEEQVRGGEYPTAGELIRAAVWRLRGEFEPDKVLAEFRAKLGESIASADRGELLDPAEVFAELQRKSAERRRKTA